MLIRVVGSGRNGWLPVAPPEIQEAVELFARKAGRTGRMHFAPLAGWFARLELRPNDPRLELYRSGRAATPPTEDVFFHVRNPFEGKIMSIREVRAHPLFKNVPLIDWWAGLKVQQKQFLQLDILQMGAEGVKRFLEREDTWSGRGEFRSLTDARVRTEDMDRRAREKARQEAEEQAALRARDARRQILDIPFVRVEADLRRDDAT